jgi:GNAT superfamily N-acetyltransferase
MVRDVLDRIVHFTRRTTELTADEVRPVRLGWIFSAPSIEVAWGLNHVRVCEPASFEELVALADEAQAHLPYRRVTLEPAAISPELEEAFRAAGWKAEHDLLMVHAWDPDRSVDTSSVDDVEEADHLRLGRLWSLEEAPDIGDDVLDALAHFWHREAEARGDRLLGVPDPQGNGILAKAKLRSDGEVAQVEDVYTVAAARGRGLGRALVTRAVQLAEDERHELIFIVADEDDWPKGLYAQIGFEPVGRVVHFHRQASVNQAAPGARSRRRTALPSG